MLLNSVYEPADALYIDYTSPACGGEKNKVWQATCEDIWVMMLVCKPDGVRFPNNGIRDKNRLKIAAYEVLQDLMCLSESIELPNPEHQLWVATCCERERTLCWTLPVGI